MMKKRNLWIVVADGAQARIYVNEGVGKGLVPVPNGEFASPNLKGREIVSDRPGRSFDRGGQGRHAMESEVDPKRHEELSFARDVAAAVDARAKRNEFDRLVLVAPPRMLGDLRSVLSKTTLELVEAEIDKDLTKAKPQDLVKHLEDTVLL